MTECGTIKSEHISQHHLERLILINTLYSFEEPFTTDQLVESANSKIGTNVRHAVEELLNEFLFYDLITHIEGKYFYK